MRLYSSAPVQDFPILWVSLARGLYGVYSANEFLTRSNLMKSYLDNPDTPIMKGGRSLLSAAVT